MVVTIVAIFLAERARKIPVLEAQLHASEINEVESVSQEIAQFECCFELAEYQEENDMLHLSIHRFRIQVGELRTELDSIEQIVATFEDEAAVLKNSTEGGGDCNCLDLEGLEPLVSVVLNNSDCNSTLYEELLQDSARQAEMALAFATKEAQVQLISCQNDSSKLAADFFVALEEDLACDAFSFATIIAAFDEASSSMNSDSESSLGVIFPSDLVQLTSTNLDLMSDILTVQLYADELASAERDCREETLVQVVSNNILQDALNQVRANVISCEVLNDNLTENVSDLESTLSTISNGFNGTTVKELADGIRYYEERQVEMLEWQMKLTVDAWPATVNLVFYADWVFDSRVSIGDKKEYEDLLTLTYAEVLSFLCVDLQDFEEYLFNRLPDLVSPEDISLRQLSSALDSLARDVLEFYFGGTTNDDDVDPDETETGSPTLEDWREASFRCDSLDENKRFYLDVVS
jgi:hypothetical protein